MTDLVLLPVTFILAILLRYDGLSEALLLQYKWLILSAPLISIPIFIKLGLYRAVIRFINYKIVSAVLLGMGLSVLGLAAVAALTHSGPVSRGVLAIYCAGAILYILASRFAIRGYLLQSIHASDRIPVAIYGAGEAGVQLASALRSGGNYVCVAFIDDNKGLIGSTIAGTKVWSPEKLPELMAKEEIREVFLAMPTLTKVQKKRILDQLEPLKVKIKVTPTIKSLLSGELRLQDVRDVEIDDLLGRDQVEPYPHLIGTCISDKVVAVTGAGGSIGSELCRQIVRLAPRKLVLLEISEFALYSIEQELQNLKKTLHLDDTEILPLLGSVLEEEKCRKIFSTFAVDTVYHAAAYKHVPLVEHNPIEGIRNNVFGTFSCAQAALAAQVKCFVLISTDKAVRPTNVMGVTKRLAELILQALAKQQTTTRFCMVRFGNVLGSSGSVVPLFRKQIMDGGPITVTHPEITRYFMTIPEAAQLVLQAGAMGEGGDVFVLDMGEPVKIMDLAKRMVHLSGMEIKSDATPDGTIEIHHVGLRPGEKLYEELLIGSNVEGTEHPLIMRAQESEIHWLVLQELLNKLEAYCHDAAYEEIRALLKHIVPEYEPQCGIEAYIWREKNKVSNKLQLPV